MTSDRTYSEGSTQAESHSRRYASGSRQGCVRIVPECQDASHKACMCNACMRVRRRSSEHDQYICNSISVSHLVARFMGSSARPGQLKNFSRALLAPVRTVSRRPRHGHVLPGLASVDTHSSNRRTARNYPSWYETAYSSSN